MAAVVQTTYTADNGTDIYRMRLSQEDFDAQPTTPTDTPTRKMYAKISRSSKAFGIKPRTVTLARTIGTAPDTAEKYKKLAVSTLADWTTITDTDSTLTIGGQTWRVVGGENESIR